MGDENGGNIGDQGNVGGSVDAGGGASTPAPATFTQDQLNAKLAENKRGLQRQLAEANAKAQAFDKLQAQVSELLSKGGFEGVEDLSGFAAQFESTLNETRSEAERTKAEAAKLKASLEAAQKEAVSATTRWESATVDRAIADEAGPRASSPGAMELIRMKLAGMSKVKPDGSVVVQIPSKNEEGKSYLREVTVKEAVAEMEADVTNYGPLFKATVNSGSGGAVDGVRRTPDGVIDFSNMSFEKFMEISKKNPDVLARSVAALRR